MNKTKKVAKKSISEGDSLRMRIIAVKSKFPKGFDYTPIYQYEFGIQSTEQLQKIRAVWNLREIDPTITSNLEKIADNINA